MSNPRGNYFKTCNTMDAPEREFREIFCNRCRNYKCELASGGENSWMKRISTQEDRLLNNPLFADPNDPRYKEVKALQFLTLVKEAINLNSQEAASDWTLNYEASPPPMFQPPEQVPPALPEPVVTPQAAPQEPAVAPSNPVPQVVLTPQQSGERETAARVLMNTPFPAGGLMVDGSKPTLQQPVTTKPMVDDWSVPTTPAPLPNVIPVGGKVVLGDKK